jgi:hypothetical protein
VVEALNEVASGQFHKDRVSRTFLVIGLACVLVAVGISVVALVHANRKTVWDPLGAFPIQHPDKSIYHLNETITVTAQKCAKQDGTHTRGTLAWVPVQNQGTIINEQGFQGLFYRSCGPDPHTHQFVFKNPIPTAVVDIVALNGPSLWRIQGVDTPYRNGTDGVPRAWQTDVFKLEP